MQPIADLVKLVGWPRILFPVAGLGIRKALKRRGLSAPEIEFEEDRLNAGCAPAVTMGLTAAFEAVVIISIFSFAGWIFPDKQYQTVMVDVSALALTLSMAILGCGNLMRFPSHLRIFDYHEILKLMRIEAGNKPLSGDDYLGTFRTARDTAAGMGMLRGELLKCLRKPRRQLRERQRLTIDAVMEAVTKPNEVLIPSLPHDNLVEILRCAGVPVGHLH